MCALCKGQAAILLDTLINEFRYCCSSLCLSLGKDNERSYYAVQEIIVLRPSKHLADKKKDTWRLPLFYFQTVSCPEREDFV